MALRYYDIADTVRNLPEYRNRWTDMSAAEHRRAAERYRSALAAGQLNAEPLYDIESWDMTQVSYTGSEGSVRVLNTKIHDTAAGPLEQKTEYVFRLKTDSQNQWKVIQYDTEVLRSSP